MRFESIKGSYDGYEYDMRENRYKPVKSKKKLGLIFLVIAIIVLTIVLLRKQPSASNPGKAEWYKPPVDASYYHQKTGVIDLDQKVDIYSIPLYSGSAINHLVSDGKKVLCQYSVGLWKDGQPALDKKFFGKQQSDQRYVIDIRKDEVRNYVAQFIDSAQKFGCNGFEPLDMNVYSMDNGLGLTTEDQESFSKWLANEAHSKGLFVGLVNSVLQLGIADNFDYALALNCFQLNECDTFKNVISLNKPVFDMETSLDADKFCSLANDLKFYAFTKPGDFGPGASYCRK